MATTKPRNPAKGRAKSAELRLRLYIAGDAPNSVLAVANAKALCDAQFGFGYKLEIVDLIKQPLRALADGVIVTPTLIRLFPLPVHRVIGNLSDTNQLILVLVGP